MKFPFLLGTVLIAAVYGFPLHTSASGSDGRSFYVDPNGSDTNAGTNPSHAWRTLGKVNSVTLLPGDTVHLKAGGLWREILQPRNGGAVGHPITFTAYGQGPKPIINGSDVVSGWIAVSKGVYRAACSLPNNVYSDGKPDWGLVHATSNDEMSPGSWYWDASSSALYIRLADDSNPSNHTIEAAVRVWAIKVTADGGEKSNIVIDGLQTERTGGYGMFFYSNAQGGVGSSGIIIRNNTVKQTGTGQFDGGQYYNAIHFSEHTELDTAPQFLNNDISYSGGHGNSINCQNADGAQIIGNRADHFNHHGFDTKSSASVIIRGNVAHDSPDNNGIYQEYSAYGLIEQNVIYNLDGERLGRGSGIQIDVGSSGTRIYNNSIFNVLTGIYLNLPAVVRYNAVSQARSAVLEANAGGTFDHNVWGLNPNFLLGSRRYDFSQWMRQGGHDGDLAEDPQWRAPDAGDFNLSPSSPCLAVKAGPIQFVTARPRS